MSDFVIDQEFVQVISELVDTIALTSEVNFENEQIDYQTIKMLIIQQTIPLILNIVNDENATGTEKILSLIAAISHLSLENFFLHFENRKLH